MSPVSLTMTCTGQLMGPCAEARREIYIGAEAKEDACDDPELPEHDKSASNSSRGKFRRENGDRCVFRTDSDSHHESNSKELFPRLSESRTDWSRDQNDTGDEDFSTSSKVVVLRHEQK